MNLILLMLVVVLIGSVELTEPVLLPSAGDQNQSTPIDPTTTTTDEIKSCSVSCDDCGLNSQKCISNLSRCMVLCECKEGYSGEGCNVLDFGTLKRKEWSHLRNETGDVISSSSYEAICKRLRNLVEDLVAQNELDLNDLNELGVLLNRLLDLNERKMYPNGEKTVENLFAISDSLIKLSTLNSTFAQSTLNLMDKIDRLGFYSQNETLHLKFQYSEAMVTEFPASNPNGIEMKSSSVLADSISLNERALGRLNQPIKVVFKIIHNSTKFGANNKSIISSNILSGVISEDANGLNENNLVRVEFTIDLKRLGLNSGAESHFGCVYWDTIEQDWSYRGSRLSKSESKFVSDMIYRQVCYFNHLTNFALLFDPDLNDETFTWPILDTFQNFLSVLTYTGVSVSCVCYLILILGRLTKFSPYKCQEQDRALGVLYLLNACCLLAANLIFLLVLELLPTVIQQNICLVISSCLNFFLLAAFGFSLAAAYQHYRKLSRPSTNQNPGLLKWILFAILFGVVFSSAAFYYQMDGPKMKICWLQKQAMYFFFVAPISALLVGSLALYLLVVFRVLSIYNYLFCSEKQQNHPTITSSFNNKRVVVLLLVSFISLGLTWFIGVFITITSSLNLNIKLIFEFLFCAMNSFHGVSLLVANYLAKKYGKPATTTESGNKSRSADHLQPIEEEPADIELTCCVRLFLCFYQLRNRWRKFMGFDRDAQVIGEHRNQTNQVNNNLPILEFSIIDSEKKSKTVRFTTVDHGFKGAAGQYWINASPVRDN